MNVNWMTLRDLEYLLAVARQLHFGKAAESCHVSQPALSTQVKKIEDMLGFVIFERTNRRVTITERGQKVVSLARVVLEEAQKIAALSRAESTEGLLKGTFRVGAIATLGPYYIPHFLPVLKKTHPELKLIIREGLTEELLEELKFGELDFVLAAQTFDANGFRVFPLFFEPFLLVVPQKHPLSKKKELTMNDLNVEEMILLEDGHCLRDQALEICPPNRRGNIKQFHATSIETLRHLVASEFGYTLIPAMAATNTLKGMLRYRSFGGSRIGREIVAVCRERFSAVREMETLAEFLRSHPPSFPEQRTQK